MGRWLGIMLGVLLLIVAAIILLPMLYTPAEVLPSKGRVAMEYTLPTSGETERPPKEFQGEVLAQVQTLAPEYVESTCVEDATACTKILDGKAVIFMPDPCRYKYDSYAALLCHEIGHVNGWRHGSGT